MSTGKRNRILIVDDEPRYLKAIKINLESSGYAVVLAQDGQRAVDLAQSENPDLIILDLRMPRMDGYEATQRIRRFSSAPIIMVTALAEDHDKVKGLDLGADDYITKPFGVDELLARIRAVLRRSESDINQQQMNSIQGGDLSIDLIKRRVTVRGQEVFLTATEFRLLQELIKYRGRVLMPEYLLEKVWGDEYRDKPRLVWQAMHRLRQKIESDVRHPRYIQTQSGGGYLFEMPESQ